MGSDTDYRRADDARFDRLENKIDKLAEAIMELVKVESTIQTIQNRQNSHGEQIKKNDERLDVLEQKGVVYDQMVEEKKNLKNIISRAVIGTVIAALVSGALGLIWVAVAN